MFTWNCTPFNIAITCPKSCARLMQKPFYDIFLSKERISMRVSDIIGLAREYLRLGIVGAVFLLTVFLIGYFIIYRKIFKGQKKIKPIRFLWWAVMACYMIVVIGATLLSRGSNWMTGRIMPLFYSYRDAWVDYSATSWRNIILNICMFVPLGFLLPLGQKRLRTAWKTYLAGFLTTLFIELAQLILQRGIFEWDDLMDNTIGAMIGYGFYALFAAFVSLFRKDKQDRESEESKKIEGSKDSEEGRESEESRKREESKEGEEGKENRERESRENKNNRESGRNIVRLAVLQMPLLAVIVVFSAIFITYENQELGNPPYQYIVKYNAKKLTVTSAGRWSTEQETLPVYQLNVLSQTEAAVFAEEFFQSLGTGLLEERNDFYENTAYFYDSDQRYSMHVKYQAGTYSLWDSDIFTDGVSAVPQVYGASEQEVKAALEGYGIQVPNGALFSENDNGTYEFRADMLQLESYVLDGTLTCDLYSDGRIWILDNKIKKAELYKEFSVISESEAYQRLCNGQFRAYVYGNAAINIDVQDCHIIYAADSKGYYQPIYDFECDINGEKGDIVIPAIQ